MDAHFKISLSEDQGKAVSLREMSSGAVASFMLVVNSIKEIACDVIFDDSELNFSILEGSAAFAVNGATDSTDLIYDEIEKAIEGGSNNRNLTKHLRVIQDQIKRDRFQYKFIYDKSAKVIDIHTKLKESKRITTARSKSLYQYKIEILSGFLNQIGGTDPNYHFDYGGGDKITIACSKAEAQSINKYLYKETFSLVVKKEWFDDEKKDEYIHKAIIDSPDIVRFMKTFFKSYYKESNLINRLSTFYDFMEKVLKRNDKFEILKLLLTAFNYKGVDINEVKTLLVITKGLKNNENIKELREELVSNYNSLLV